MLWRIDEFINALSAKSIGNLPDGIHDITIDSRNMPKGAAFFAIQGVSQDGHLYVEHALKNGAALAVIAKEKAQQFRDKDLPLIIVDDVLIALENLGKAARERSHAKIIAITGSAGKTSTKDMLRCVLERIGKTHASPASFNNHWGVPLTLARLPENADFGIFEIGMNHPGEISPLVKLVQPDIAIITTVGAAHLGQFQSIAQIAEAKAEIFDGLKANHGIAILNADNDHFSFLSEQVKQKTLNLISFGRNMVEREVMTHIQLVANTLTSQGQKIEIKSDKKDKITPLNLNIIGDHMAFNCAGIYAVLTALNLDAPQNIQFLSQYHAGSGRGEIIPITLKNGIKITLLDESYNANPLSMAATLRSLGQIPVPNTSRKIAVLGDMLELGTQSKFLHAALAEIILKQSIDLVFLVGTEMRHLETTLPNDKIGGITNTSIEMSEILISKLQNDDHILIKGSNGLKLTQLIEAIKQA